MENLCHKCGKQEAKYIWYFLTEEPSFICDVCYFPLAIAEKTVLLNGQMLCYLENVTNFDVIFRNKHYAQEIHVEDFMYKYFPIKWFR